MVNSCREMLRHCSEDLLVINLFLKSLKTLIQVLKGLGLINIRTPNYWTREMTQIARIDRFLQQFELK